MRDIETDDLDVKITKEFFLVASQYCTFLERLREFDTMQIPDYLLKILPLMYLKAGLLSDAELEDNSTLEQFVTEEQYEILRLEVGKAFSENDYFTLFDPTNQETHTYSLSEMLADLYLEMKNFVLLCATNKHSSQTAAVWLCQRNFTQDWGLKLLQVLQYIHTLTFSACQNDDEIE